MKDKRSQGCGTEDKKGSLKLAAGDKQGWEKTAVKNRRSIASRAHGDKKGSLKLAAGDKQGREKTAVKNRRSIASRAHGRQK